MDATSYIRFVLALGVVLGLIGVFALLLRRYGPGAGFPVARAEGQRRLAVVEALALDARRRLVLVRRDGMEHLLLLGAERDVVVETGIAADDGAGFQAALDRAAPDGAARQDRTASS